MKIGFYGDYPESWNLTEEQKVAMLQLETLVIAIAEDIEPPSCDAGTQSEDPATP